jgi:hypothetical protein
MIGYILTIDQYQKIQGKHFSSYECFSCVQDINGIWFNFVSEQQIPEIQKSEYAWVLDLPEGEYTPPPAPPFPI